MQFARYIAAIASIAGALAFASPALAGSTPRSQTRHLLRHTSSESLRMLAYRPFSNGRGGYVQPDQLLRARPSWVVNHCRSTRCQVTIRIYERLRNGRPGAALDQRVTVETAGRGARFVSAG